MQDADAVAASSVGAIEGVVTALDVGSTIPDVAIAGVDSLVAVGAVVHREHEVSGAIAAIAGGIVIGVDTAGGVDAVHAAIHIGSAASRCFPT